MKNIGKIILAILGIATLALPLYVWCSYGADLSTVVTNVLTLWVAAMAVIVVIVGWQKSLELQRKANRDNAKLEAMKQYQSQLQERYEKMLEVLAPFVSSMQTYSSLIGFSDQVSNTQLKTFFEGLHEDAKKMESGVLPYYLTLQSNTFFDEDLVNIHAQNIDRLSGSIRDILGHPLIPKSNGVTIQTFVTLNNLQDEFIREAYTFMRAISQAIKVEIGS